MRTQYQPVSCADTIELTNAKNEVMGHARAINGRGSMMMGTQLIEIIDCVDKNLDITKQVFVNEDTFYKLEKKHWRLSYEMVEYIINKGTQLEIEKVRQAMPTYLIAVENYATCNTVTAKGNNVLAVVGRMLQLIKKERMEKYSKENMVNFKPTKRLVEG